MVTIEGTMAVSVMPRHLIPYINLESSKRRMIYVGVPSRNGNVCASGNAKAWKTGKAIRRETCYS